MGVTGLWRLIEPTGKPVPVETLENKVLAVDISIWLHQMVKGYQDAKGAPLPNAHLMGLFQRLCKLLYFRIKPVFVFDGAFPDLKKDTIAKRQDNKSKYHSESERLKRELALLLSKKTAVSSLLGKQISPKKAPRSDIPHGTNDDDLFKLPALPDKNDESESDSEDEIMTRRTIDLHSFDLESDKFKNMPIKEKYDVLIELKESRKMNSWRKLHELPKKSDNFSDFQMERLLKRRKVHECLVETEKEMGSYGMSLNDLESLLNEEGIDTKIESLPTRRIASNNSTRYLLIQNVKKTLAEAREQKNKQLKEVDPEPGPSRSPDDMIPTIHEADIGKNDELEDDLQKAIQMSLECVDEPNTSAATSNKTDESWSTFITDSEDSSPGSDSEENDGFEEPDSMSTARAYIMQYSDFTHNAIDNIILSKKKSRKKKGKAPQVNKILKELNKEKPLIADKVNLSSDDESDIEYVDQEQNVGSKSDLVSDTNVIELDTTTSEDLDLTTDDVQLVTTEVKVINVEDSQNEIFSLEIPKQKENDQESILIVNSAEDVFPDKNIKSESASSDEDDDFEEVLEDATAIAVVELTLDIGKAPEDDIFADVFSDSNVKTTLIDESLKSNLEGITNLKDVDFSEIEVNTNKEQILENVTELNTDKALKLSKISAATKTCQENEIIHTDLISDKSVKISSYENTNAIKSPTREHNTEIDCDISNINIKKNQPEAIMKTVTIPKDPITTENLNSMVEQMENEESDLLKEKGRLDRIGRNITEQMTKEAQELLQIFGIPYVVAPMEAEAQCAFLESVNLTDGTITDDSDIWLFGGRTVYKNFFNQKKHVLQFLAEKIERSFNLSRDQMILLALLVGSDYTTGVPGVGPVTAMEILASFPYNKKQVTTENSDSVRHAKLVSGLQDFKKWVRSGKRTDNTSLKKKLRNVDVTDDFPSVRVVQAYLEPNVEKSKEKFTWGELDMTILRDYTKSKFGWSQNKFDEIIKPVLKRMQNRQTQRTLQDYFKRKIEFSSLEDQMSKRVKAAVQKMGPELPLDLQAEAVFAVPQPPKKRKTTKMSKSNTSEQVDLQLPNEVETCKSDKAPSMKNVAHKFITNVVKVKSVNEVESKNVVNVKINKTDRFQEVIPQREKDKKSLLQNKLRAIEVFRKTKLDRKRQPKKRKVILPKEDADLSESSDSN